MVSKDIILFDINVVAVGTTSDNISSKRKTLDEDSLLSSKLET